MATKHSKHKKITFFPEKDFKRQQLSNNSRNRSNQETETESEGPGQIAYLQPEILPIHMMKSLLITRGGRDLENETLEKIISLFYKHITPKPQRHYRKNRRGRFLLQMRMKREKFKTDTKEEWNIMKTSETKPSQLISSKSPPLSPSTDSSVSRLKRPISCIDPEKKKIRLNSSSSGSSLDNIQVKHKEITAKKVHSEDLNKSSRKSSDIEIEEIKPTKKIKLIRNDANPTTTTQQSSTKTKVASESKEKRKPISWP